MISRRAMLSALAAGIATPAVAQMKPHEEEALAVRARRKGLVFGAALATGHLQDARFAAIFADECGMIVPEWEAKWRVLQPQPGRFDFTAPDRLAEFARARNRLLRGHTLVWHLSVPDWLAEAVSPATANRVLVEHIGAAIGRYRGRVHSWDVVNEPLEPND
jgi:endo-1,4-beta-xylanase